MADPIPVPCEFPPSGNPDADGETLRALAEDPAGPERILLCPGVYRPSRAIAVERTLAIAPANPGSGEVTVDGGWSGGGAGDGHGAFRIGAGGGPGNLELERFTGVMKSWNPGRKETP